jgi:methylenetetrahydrofolate--tRNA-(uracil-5-)-methyltransferase
MKTVKIIGAGLAGSEAAWQIAKRGHRVEIFEMRPTLGTKAHSTGLCAELVCSNSFRGAALNNAVGLLKEELKLWDSLIMNCALKSEVPAGGALAVDRVAFSEMVDKTLREHPNITFHEQEITKIEGYSAEEPLIVASGPLSSPKLTSAIERLTGDGNLAFFDAISPILYDESIDKTVCFRQSRYDKGEGDDYLNVPLSKEEYYEFVEAVKAAEKYTGNIAVESDSLEKLRPFEGCMPIEDMIERGDDTLLFGPFKPVGLRDPRTNSRPYAVLQLRQDDLAGKLWSMVGMQTRMKRADQDRIFRSLPGLHSADFVRYGSVHRNTFIESPRLLDSSLEFRNHNGLFFAGQITGTEGYVESTAGGLLAGINASHLLDEKPLLKPPEDTAIGALMQYISDPSRKDFQPMNISFGLMTTYLNSPNRDERGKKIGKKDRRLAAAARALGKTKDLIAEINL